MPIINPTRQEVTDEINLKLADFSNIEPTEHRDVLETVTNFAENSGSGGSNDIVKYYDSDTLRFKIEIPETGTFLNDLTIPLVTNVGITYKVLYNDPLGGVIASNTAGVIINFASIFGALIEIPSGLPSGVTRLNFQFFLSTTSKEYIL